MTLLNKKQTLKALRGIKLTPKHRDLVTCFASYFFQCLEYYSTLLPAEGPLGGITCALRFLESKIRSVSFTECKSSTFNPKNIHQTPVLGNMSSWWKHGILCGSASQNPSKSTWSPAFNSPLFDKNVEFPHLSKGKQNGRPPKRHQTSNKRHRRS